MGTSAEGSIVVSETQHLSQNSIGESVNICECLQVGQTTCKACPDNTESVPPATSLQDCRCKKGYYSPVYDDTQSYGMPGFACVSCSSADLTLRLGQV